MRLHAIITGRVQGVGFRYFVAREADKLNVGGWVRNLGRDRVEVVAEGERARLERLGALLQQGPPGAAVQHAELSWTETQTDTPGFAIRPSA